jgi:hypothetical protein
MGLIPHHPIYLSLIRTTDIWFLLGVGALYELLCRLYILNVKIKPSALSVKEAALKALQVETDAKRKLGPSAFVETSKLERQVLAMEKEVETSKTARKKKSESVEKILLKGGNIRLAILIWVLYYSVPVLIVEDLEVSIGEYSPAGALLKNLFFPISYSGFGYRIANFGLPADVAVNSLGALVVMWSAQTTVGKLMDAVDAFCLC